MTHRDLKHMNAAAAAIAAATTTAATTTTTGQLFPSQAQPWESLNLSLKTVNPEDLNT